MVFVDSESSSSQQVSALVRSGGLEVSPVASRKLTLTLSVLIGLTVWPAPAAAQRTRTLDTTYVTRSATTLRVEPSDSSNVRTHLTQGTPVVVLECRREWCTASAWGLSGYLHADSLRADVRATPATPARRAVLSSPSSGPSAQCRDGSYSYSRSRSGTCSHHGGVARWL